MPAFAPIRRVDGGDLVANVCITSRWNLVDLFGWALMSVPDDGRDLPCHRVVNRVGLLSGGWHFGHPDVMRGLLLAEDVPFCDEYQVDLDRCLWEPWIDDEDETARSGFGST